MRLTSWLLKIIALLSVGIILQARYEIGPFGFVLVAIVAIIWMTCSYMEVMGNDT